MNRIALALTFPLRYYGYLTAPACRPVAAAPLEAEWPAVRRLAG